MSFRAWISIVTLLLVVILIYISRHELIRAWELLGSVNIWVLLLLIPGQLLVYYAAGEMIFSYLRSKKSIDDISSMTLARISLELNFVNHVLPSGGVSGFSYMNWRLKPYGVSAGRGAMAQVVRYSMGFAAFILLLAISVVIVTIDGNINRWIILFSSMLVFGMVMCVLAFGYLVSTKKRTMAFSAWLGKVINKLVRKITFGRKRQLVNQKKLDVFFDEMHDDYIALKHDKAILIKPFLWGLVLTLGEMLLFLITFWALGVNVNPASVLIAYGIATLVGFFVVTPGGAGAYEAAMVAILAVAGISHGIAIAGIVLTRVIILMGTIVLGYIFYQHTIIKHGKRKST